MSGLNIEGNVVAEFIPENPELIRSGGRLVLRSLSPNANNSPAHVDLFFQLMARYALNSRPPVVLDRQDARIVHYGTDQTEMHPDTYGVEAVVAAGHVISPDFNRRI